MDVLKLNASKRDVFGKKTRFLRRQGITPAHLFGHSIKSQAHQCDAIELRKIISQAGNTRLVSLKIEGDKQAKNVFVKEVQQDPLHKHILHVDLYQVRKGQKMAVVVPIVLIGEAPALKGKGRMLSHGITSLSIECLPEKVPPQIEVDISVLEEYDQSLFVKDIVLDPDITVHAEPEQLVVKISEAFVQAEEVAVSEEEGEEAAAEAAAAEAGEQPSAESSGEEAK